VEFIFSNGARMFKNIFQRRVTMRVNLMTTMVALAVGAFQIVSATAAKAADTAVTCNNPNITVNTGRDATSPRLTIECLGGSSAGNIVYFGYRISTDPSIAALLSQTFQTNIFQTGGGSIVIASNLEDASGSAWGCGAANCRIIDYLVSQ
jgi:hypothetical protein